MNEVLERTIATLSQWKLDYEKQAANADTLKSLYNGFAGGTQAAINLLKLEMKSSSEYMEEDIFQEELS